MKLKNIFIVTTSALVLVIGLLVVFILVKNHANSPEPNTLAAAPAVQSASVTSASAGLPALSGAKSVSDAKDFIVSITEGELASGGSVSRTPAAQPAGYVSKSFVITFKQDMDESTLNSSNILGYTDNDPAQINCTYDAATKELQVDINLDASKGDLNTETLYILLTKNIKTAGGDSIGSDYVFSSANNR